MSFNPAQRRLLEDRMRSKRMVGCPACGEGGWRFAEAAYVRALLEEGDEDLTESIAVLPNARRAGGRQPGLYSYRS